MIPVASFIFNDFVAYAVFLDIFISLRRNL